MQASMNARPDTMITQNDTPPYLRQHQANVMGADTIRRHYYPRRLPISGNAPYGHAGTTFVGTGGGKTAPTAAIQAPSEPTSAPATSPANTNTGGAGLAGNGSLIDTLTSALGSGGNGSGYGSGYGGSPSDAGVMALRPTAAGTSSSTNPAVMVLIIGLLVAAGAYFYFKHKKHGKPAEQK